MLGIGAVVIAGGIFAGGMAAGAATNAPEGASPRAAQGAHVNEGAQPGASSASVSSTGSAAAPTGGADAATGSASASAPTVMCPGTLPAGTITGSTVNLGAAGLTPRLPGEGFVLQSLNLRGDGPCDGSGPNPPVLDTQWRHTTTGLEVWISQAAGQQAVPDVVSGTSASFTTDGYTFRVNVGGVVAMAADGVAPASPPAPSPGVAPGGPMIPAPDPRAAELLGTLLKTLAPSLSDSCFAHQVAVGWDGLSRLGIGDPRPAIPSGWAQGSVSAVTYEPATTDCGAPAFEGGGSFSATFTRADGQGALGINVNLMPSAVPDAGTGYISDYNVSWTDGRLSYSVWMKSPDKADRPLLTGIAKALDPSLDVSKLRPEPAGGGIEPQPAPAPPETTPGARGH